MKLRSSSLLYDRIGQSRNLRTRRRRQSSSFDPAFLSEADNYPGRSLPSYGCRAFNRSGFSVEPVRRYHLNPDSNDPLGRLIPGLHPYPSCPLCSCDFPSCGCREYPLATYRNNLRRFTNLYPVRSLRRRDLSPSGRGELSTACFSMHSQKPQEQHRFLEVPFATDLVPYLTTDGEASVQGTGKERGLELKRAACQRFPPPSAICKSRLTRSPLIRTVPASINCCPVQS